MERRYELHDRRRNDARAARGSPPERRAPQANLRETRIKVRRTMDFEWTEVQRSWREKAKALGRELAEDAAAGDVVTGAARVGIIDPKVDLLSAALAVEALACESPAAGMTLALHTTTQK